MTALIVPVNVAALCVGRGDASDAGGCFTKLAADFYDVPYTVATATGVEVENGDGQLVGSDLLPKPFVPDDDPPPAGVHLHWALPAALARGAANGGQGVEFRRAPNRWLLVRLLAGSDPPQPALTAWIVESDQLWEGGDGALATDPQAQGAVSQAQNQLSRAVPTGGSTTDKGFRRLGRVYPLTGYTGNAGTHYLDRLTAVGYATPAFAAAYPHCRNVFGCYDLLDGIEAGTVSYLVAGWYDDPADDPVTSFQFTPAATGPARAAALSEEFGWSFDASLGVPDRVVCSGIVHGVPWQADGSYLGQGMPAADAHGPAVVLANSLPEAVARLISAQHPDLAGADTLIEALALGLLHDTGDPDALLGVEEKRHQSRFGSRPGGTSWLVQAAVQASAALQAGAQRAPMPPCAGELDALNLAQRELDARTAELEWRRDQIYADWCAYISNIYAQRSGADTALGAAAQGLIEAELTALHSAELLANAAGQNVTAAMSKLKSTVGDAWTVTLVPAPRHWVPNDPVVLMAGNALEPSDRYGSSDRTVTLPCRQAGELISSVSASAPTLTFDTRIPNLPAELAALLREAVLLVSSPAATVTPPGVVPAEIAFRSWAQPWIPLIMQWETTVGAVDAGGDVAAPRAAYPSDLLSGPYRLQPDEADLRFTGSPPDPWLKRDGTTTLAARTDLGLRSALLAYSQQYAADPRAAELLAALPTVSPPAMAQTLSGFHTALLMRYQQLQLRPYDPLAPAQDATGALASFTNTDVAGAVAGAPTWEPVNTFPYDPLRAVTVRVTGLQVVDAFGRFVSYPVPQTVVARSLQGDAVTGTEFDNPNPNQAELAVLPPRIAQGARLMFRWLSAGSDAVETNSDPATSPIFGWLLFDHLDSRLMVYDSGGTPVASLGSTGEVWQGAPGSATYGTDLASALDTLTGDTAHPANRHLALFLGGICHYAQGGVTGADFVAALLSAIDAQLTGTNPGGSQADAALSLLIGRPLALARASLRLELLGPPALDQSLAALRTRAAPPLPGDPTAGPDAGITSVRVPVRLGDPGKASDGLVGYFVDPAGGEGESGYQTFFSWSASGGPGVVAPDPGLTAVCPGPALTPASAVTLSMLIDPRGSVQAATGLLPVKQIQIPADHYTPTFRSLAVAFLTAPVLLAGDAFPVPIPAEPGYDWSWLTKTPSAWTHGPVNPPPLAASGTFVSNQIVEGWLTLVPKPTAVAPPTPPS